MQNIILLGVIFGFAMLLVLLIVVFLHVRRGIQHSSDFLSRQEERERLHTENREGIMRILLEQQKEQHAEREKASGEQLKNFKLIVDSVQQTLVDIRTQVTTTLINNAGEIGKRVDKLAEATSGHLKEISGQVEKRLAEGFEKTTATFTDVVKRLALIDEAQKRITELSGSVVGLQEILADKRSRGAFGEVQLSALLANVLPQENFALQHTLSNGNRADCVLFLPEPTGNVIIDAKFPLESYRKFSDVALTEDERRSAEKQFGLDVKKHLQDIAEKYIISGETSDGALMFIPAEAIFAEIHAHYPDLVDLSHQLRVWMVSPTTMMAILTTARAVLKDAATRKQVHVIQQHLVALGKDFERFQKRMDNLAKHINQAHIDVEEVHQSSRKISGRFGKIERVDLSRERAVLFDAKEEAVFSEE